MVAPVARVINKAFGISVFIGQDIEYRHHVATEQVIGETTIGILYAVLVAQRYEGFHS